MAKFNKTFELNVDDMEMIERALRLLQEEAEAADPREVNDLLGRLHNQKVFFRPREGVYISG